MKRLIYIICVNIWTALLAMAFVGCSDNLFFNNEGEKAKVILQVNLGDMTPLTRANMSEALINRVNNLWVGIYNKQSGERVASKFIEDINQNFPEDKSGQITLDAMSGECYIVAVANYKNNNGINIKEGINIELGTLLDNADTWDTFREITIRHNFPDYAVVDVPTADMTTGIVMQGSYRDKGHQNSYLDDEPETIMINPGTNTLTGKIHLRRLWSQNTVNISSGGNVISLEVTAMEIHNVPEFTWLQSRSQGENASHENMLEYANAGDAQNPKITGVTNPYKNSLVITPTSMDITTTQDKQTEYSYSFWQYENKRTGISDKCEVYADREKEYKDENNANTGIYSSLCPNTTDIENNNATFITFKANIKYKTKPNSSIKDITEDFSDVTYRTAEATYVVHLGYIGDTPTDFNCYRNHRYTYNIKVTDINKILVEAFNDDEQQPGAEGKVTDITNKYYELDCHFNVFNIYLTKEELNAFTFFMRTYEDGVAHEIKYLKNDNGEIEHNVPEKDNQNWKYYSWIQFVRNNDISSSEDTKIAEFPRLKEDGTPEDGNKLYYLKDIAEKRENLIASGKTGQGFTVYVKEYTYEPDYGETFYGDETQDIRWPHYVNQPDRTAHFNVSYKESLDKESIYFRAKYALSQKSIQTYYDVSKVKSSGKEATALGIEHNNEVFGLNLRWPSEISNLSSNNGRYNVYKGYGGKDNVKWSSVVDLGNIQEINKIDNTKQTELAYHVSTSAHISPVPKTVQIAPSALTGTAGLYNGKASTNHDPQTSSNTAQYIHALNACMNRNKDENGNGLIDNAELKWYVPASGKYLRIIIGRNSLTTPIMNYEQATLPEGCGNDANTLYHFAASDNKIIWVDEGASSSMFYGGGNWSHAPWQVRCIRNLGTDLTTIVDGEKVIPAYLTESSSETYGGVVKVNKYHGNVLRMPQATPLPLHKTNDGYNRLALYGFEIAPRGNDFDSNSFEKEADATINGTDAIKPGPDRTDMTPYNEFSDAISSALFCKTLNEKSGRTGWRVPNQKELVIMLRMGILSGTSKNNWGDDGNVLSCTQEHWTNYAAGSKPAGSSDVELNWQYRVLGVSASSGISTAVNNGKGFKCVRCVRDITAAEANMSYQQMLNNGKSSSRRRSKRK